MPVISASRLPLDCGAIARRIATNGILLANRSIRRSDILKFDIPDEVIDFFIEADLCTSKGNKISYLSDQDFAVPLSSDVQEKLVHFLSRADYWRELYEVGALHFDSAEKTNLLVRYNLYPQKYAGLRNLLTAFGLFVHDSNVQSSFLLSLSCTQIVSKEILSYRKPTKRSVSPDQLEKELARKKIYGERAELFVMDFEMMRLKDDDLFSKVIHVALENTAAGYDIQSFSTEEGTTLPRFIEVKSVGDDMAFYLSRNEVRVAEELGNDYFLYLVQRSRMEDETYTPRIIRDPFKKIFRDGDWSFRPDSFKVTPGG